MEEHDSPRSSGESRFCRPFCWEKGQLNDSSYRAFCSFAGHLLNQHASETDSILAEIAGRIESAGDTADPGKLIQQFSDAFAFISRQRAAESLGATEFFKSTTKWPEPEPALIESIGEAFATRTLAWWESISPAQASTPGEVLPVLFPPKALVCYGLKEDVHYLHKLGYEFYQIACCVQYLVPNPAKAPFINLPDGRLSRKCKENFPERRFLIIEFDRKKFDADSKLSQQELLDLQAAFHAHLEAEWAPLAMLVYSGHVSLHGWYPCLGVDEGRVLAFLRYACRLGADHCLSAKSFFTRMPGGVHENGRRQTIHYFNPPKIL
jgi:hypothetical protein